MKNIIIMFIVCSFIFSNDRYEYLVTEYCGIPDTELGFLFKIPFDEDSNYNTKWIKEEESRGTFLQNTLNLFGEDGWEYSL